MKNRAKFSVFGAVWGAMFSLESGNAQVNVLTYHNDLARTGQNLNELLLTPNNVNTEHFGRLFSYPVDGEVYAQPLYMSGIQIANKGIHNVVFVATEHDSVYAFDADDGSGPNSTPLWQVSFLNPAFGVTTVSNSDIGCDQIAPEIGITGTPVIDPSSGTIFVVAMTKEASGGSTSYVHRLHALDLSSGAEKPNSPVEIQASVPGNGDGGMMVTLIPKNYKARPGLLWLNGVVYTSWSSHCDAGTYHGWLIGYDAASLNQVSVYNESVNGGMGSFWAGGAAPAADSEGNIYLISGNGSFNANQGGPDLGESFIKLASTADLPVLDWFTPFNQQSLNASDTDTGSGGALLLPDSAGSTLHPKLLTGAGKEGRIYLLDRDSMGHFQSGSDSQIVQSIAGGIGPIFGMPAYFKNAVYFSGTGDSVKAFSIDNGTLSREPVSMSPEAYGFPGSVPSISADGNAGGIVWAIRPEYSGALYAYDASNLANELYNSQQNAERDAPGSYVKFSVPTVVNGKVYAGTENSLAVFGLLQNSPAQISAGVNAAGFVRGPVAPGSLMSVFGTNLADGSHSASATPLPTELAGTSLSIHGMLAPLLYVSADQINAQVPFEVAPGSVNMKVFIHGQSSAPERLQIQATAPGVFTSGQNQAALQNADGSLNSQQNPAATGTEIAAYLSGQGEVSPEIPDGIAAPVKPPSLATGPVTASIGGTSAEVVFAGLSPDLVGVFQVNLKVPVLASGIYPLMVTVDGATSNGGLIAVK